MRAIREVDALKLRTGGSRQSLVERVVVEEPLEIRVDGETIAITMRTPGHDRELAVGFLHSEGIVESRDQLGSVAHCGRPDDEGFGNTIDVRSAAGRPIEIEAGASARRGTLTTSACGVCGRRTIDDLLARCRARHSEIAIPADRLIGLTDRLRDAQPTFATTGGAHAAGLATLDGDYVLVREDVGRHNAVDKLVGRLLIDGSLPASGHVLVVSGRTSFEIVQKALAAGIAGVIGVSAPTSLAVATAERAGLFLAGFCRGSELTLYAGKIAE